MNWNGTAYDPETFFDALMRSAMALGGRRLAVEWKGPPARAGLGRRTRTPHDGESINLNLRFGMLSPPLAAQAGYRPELLEHEQQDADCIAPGGCGIATDGEVRKMRQRLVKAVDEDTGAAEIVGAYAHDRRRQETLHSDKQTAGRRKERA